MHPAVEAILSRRSVREGFARDPIPVAVLEEVVRCGLSAPSSKNARPWRFHVVTDPSVLEGIAAEISNADEVDAYVPFDPRTGKPWPSWSSTVLESADVLRSVPAAIFVENKGIFSRGRAALVDATPDALAASITGYSLEVMGVGAAVQNLWIAAVAHGLVGVFMGDVLIAEQAIKARLSIESDVAGVLVLGYPAEGERRGPAVPELASENVRWHGR